MERTSEDSFGEFRGSLPESQENIVFADPIPEFKDQQTELLQLKEQAKTFFLKKDFSQAYEKYKEALPLTEFKDDVATLHSNMTQCALNLNQTELALTHVHLALKSAQTELPIVLRIKLKYRLAQALLRLRDFRKCKEVLKNLKTYCGMEHQDDMF